MKKSICICVCFLLAGCSAASHRPMVDLSSSHKSSAQYNYDLCECQAYARQIAPEKQMAIGAVAGAVIGAGVAAAFGLRKTAIRQIATAGAAGGLLGGASNAMQRQVLIIKRCMITRGYKVLD